MSDPILSAGQKAALDVCLDAIDTGKAGFIFVTGKAGTGKSVTLRELRRRRQCVVVAPTGLAAVNVGGSTLHRTFGFPIGPMTRGRARAMRRPEVAENAAAIVIDEISMVRADLIDGLDACLQKTLGNKLPFGGVPIVAFGDMWQLEPVVGENEREWMAAKYRSPFWFDAHVFNHSEQAALELEDPPARISIATCELTDVFRQADPVFVDALNAIRVGDPSGLAAINTRAWAEPAGEEPVALTFTNKAADAINASRLAALPADVRAYPAVVDGSFDPRDMPVPESLELKVGAQVMVARNIDLGDDEGSVANGAVGTVAGFVPSGPIVRLRDGRIIVVPSATWQKMSYDFDLEKDAVVERVDASFTQIPLKLAWAITTHKSQGQTLDAATLELETKAFSHGQLYVALSRVRSLGGLYLRRPIGPRDIVVNPRVQQFCRPPVNLEAFA